MTARPDIPWHVGCTDESFGVQVWINRIENLKTHLRIIRDYLPDDKTWLANQVASAIAEADRYIADAVPADDAQGIEAAAADETQSVSAVGESPVVEDHAPEPSTQTHTTKKKGE